MLLKSICKIYVLFNVSIFYGVFRPTKDPIARLREEKEVEPLDPNVPAEDIVKQAVCQFADMPYEDQLAAKMVEIEKLMATLRKEFLHQVTISSVNTELLVTFTDLK
jgi:hypothetical protein